jgi:hypothetical protein
VPEREIPRHEGEPEHGRPRTEDQRFEGEETARRPKGTFVVGEGGELIPEDEIERGFFLEKAERVVDVPPEYRRYVTREDIPKLPPGTRVHQGPRGGLFVDIRELPEHVRERVGRREKEFARPASGRGWKEYSGWIRGGFNYTVSVDPSGEVGTIALSKEGYRIKLEVGIKTGRVRVLEADIPNPSSSDVAEKAVEIVSRVPVNIMANSLYAAFRFQGVRELPDRPHRLVVNRRINEVTSDMSVATISGEDIDLGRHGGVYPALRDFEKNKFHRIGRSKVFVHESLDINAISGRIGKYLELINEENFSGIVVVPAGSLKRADDSVYLVAGFHDPQNDIVVLDEQFIEYAFLHEYFHGIYAVFERLRAIESIISNIRNMFYDALKEAGFTSDTLRHIKVEDEVAQEVVDRVVRSYDYSEIFDVIDHYLETSNRKIPEVVRILKKIIDKYGGMRVLEEFRKAVQEFLKDDGITHYSYSFYSRSQQEGWEKFVSLTEAFASFADYIAELMYIMERDNEFKEMVISKYGRDFSKWLNQELYEKVAERVRTRFRELDENRVRQLETMSRLLKYAKGVFKK